MDAIQVPDVEDAARSVRSPLNKSMKTEGSIGDAKSPRRPDACDGKDHPAAIGRMFHPWITPWAGADPHGSRHGDCL
jgi:hypothetical protein